MVRALSIILLSVGWAWVCMKLAKAINNAMGGSILKRWAQANGYTVLQAELRLLFRGPFTWKSTKGDFVYYLHIREASNVERRGWVKFTPVWPYLIPGIGKAKHRVFNHWES